ncbi:MAG: 1-acyl-sn-glycerol-3-phosphate acyltransferase [Bacteroidales bacterium]|nr:1-acyl-sn-glycerol-3-phosphate acyltransferase [Bacteroidales bacterium]
MNATKEYINIHSLIKASNSKLLKRLPNFVISLIKIIIRQTEINRILSAYADYEGVEFLSKIKDELNINIEIDGMENLPENGKCFFVANHPFGFVDGLILTNTVACKYGDFRAIGNEVFTLIPHMRPIVAAVNVFGTNPRLYLTELEKLFASDLPITHFPAGFVSRINKRKIEDSEWQKGFIKKAVKYQRNIIPFYFYGRNSCLFHSIYAIRKIFGIKTNLELVFLFHELFNKRNKTIKVKIGEPISYQVFDKYKTHYEWAQFVKEQVYNLKSSQ